MVYLCAGRAAVRSKVGRSRNMLVLKSSLADEQSCRDLKASFFRPIHAALYLRLSTPSHTHQMHPYPSRLHHQSTALIPPDLLAQTKPQTDNFNPNQRTSLSFYETMQYPFYPRHHTHHQKHNPEPSSPSLTLTHSHRRRDMRHPCNV